MKTWIALAGPLLLTGCGFGIPTGGTATPQPDRTGTAAAPAPAPGASSAPAPAGSATPAGAAARSAPASTSSPRGAAASSASQRGSSGTGSDSYRIGKAWYFKAPSGNIFCAINPATPQMAVGCQANLVVAGMSKCSDPASRAPAVWIPADENAAVVKDCVNQGFFINPDAKVLPYGAVLSAGGYRCESRTTGMDCGLEGTDRGFTIAREGIETSG